MKKRTKIVIGIIALICQVLIFNDYLMPIQWGQIKVTGLVCTCPDETVVNGQWYLKSITPDSLKKYNLDYSEIYVTENLSSKSDLHGTDNYIIKGKVIGKERVYEGDPWNPKVKIEEWKQLNFFGEYLTKGIFLIQILIFISWTEKNKN